jgi:CubicO group peptidase (beta-lactamase class C family)
VDRGVLAGAVALVADKHRVLDVAAVGFADLAARQRMKPDTLFWIASQSKPITCTALMMLVDEGKVRVDDPVEVYLPEFRDQWLAVEQDAQHVLLRRPRHPITVRNVMTHTSGMPFSSALETPTLDGVPLRLTARSYAMTSLQSEPDSKYQYSNAGTNTAGAIIEVVSGMPYEAFLDRRLLRPLGMKDTTFWPSPAQVRRLATAYKPTEDKAGMAPTTIGQLTYPLTNRGRHPMPAGGLFSTAADVARFCQMVLNGGVFQGRRYLSAAAVREMTRKQTADGVAEGYGFGWGTDGKVFGHGGALSTNMSIDPQRGLVLVYLVQHAGFPGNGHEAYVAFKAAAETFARGQAP